MKKLLTALATLTLTTTSISSVVSCDLFTSNNNNNKEEPEDLVIDWGTDEGETIKFYDPFYDKTSNEQDQDKRFEDLKKWRESEANKETFYWEKWQEEREKFIEFNKDLDARTSEYNRLLSDLQQKSLVLQNSFKAKINVSLIDVLIAENDPFTKNDPDARTTAVTKAKYSLQSTADNFGSDYPTDWGGLSVKATKKYAFESAKSFGVIWEPLDANKNIIGNDNIVMYLDQENYDKVFVEIGTDENDPKVIAAKNHGLNLIKKEYPEEYKFYEASLIKDSGVSYEFSRSNDRFGADHFYFHASPSSWGSGAKYYGSHSLYFELETEENSN